MRQALPPTREYWFYEHGRVNKSVGLISPDYLLAMYLIGSASNDAGLVRVSQWERLWHLNMKEPIQRAVKLWKALPTSERIGVLGLVVMTLDLVARIFDII